MCIYIYLYMYICASKKTWGGHLGLAVLKFGLTVSVCIIIGLQGDTWWWLKLVLQLVVVINNDSVLWYSCNMLQYIYIYDSISDHLQYIWCIACIRAVRCLILPILDDLSPHDSWLRRILEADWLLVNFTVSTIHINMFYGEIPMIHHVLLWILMFQNGSYA